MSTNYQPFDALIQDIKQNDPRLFDVLSKISKHLKNLYIILKVGIITIQQITWTVATLFSNTVTIDSDTTGFVEGDLIMLTRQGKLMWQINYQDPDNTLYIKDPSNRPGINLVKGGVAPFGAFGGVALFGDIQFIANASTGGNSASLGANCPAGTFAAPYIWVNAYAPDGTKCVMPLWKV